MSTNDPYAKIFNPHALPGKTTRMVTYCSGPLSESEAQVLALEQREQSVVEGAKLVRYHLSQCEHGDAKTWAAFEALLCYAGIRDKVVPQPVSQPAGEMACHNEE